MMKMDIYETVTNAIIEAIEAGQTADKFVMPWSGASELPINGITGNPYRGINIPMLWAMQQKNGFQSEEWGTYKQWKEKGAQVRKGEKSSHIVFWKAIDVEPEDDNSVKEIRSFAKWTAVFNADQVDGYESSKAKKQLGTVKALEKVEKYIENTQAVITNKEQQAYYDRKDDYINMPSKELFVDTEDSSATENYYATLLHELTHWTGAPARLHREKGKKFADTAYAFEELIAELGAAMASAHLGITNSPRDDHAQYIDMWLHKLKNDKKYIFKAASQAQKAVDYLNSLQVEDEKIAA